MFRHCIDEDENVRLFQSWMYGLGSEEDLKGFRCKLKFKGVHETLTYEGPIVSIEKTLDQVTEDCLGIVISDHLARRLWDGKEIKLYVEVTEGN